MRLEGEEMMRTDSGGILQDGVVISYYKGGESSLLIERVEIWYYMIRILLALKPGITFKLRNRIVAIDQIMSKTPKDAGIRKNTFSGIIGPVIPITMIITIWIVTVRYDMVSLSELFYKWLQKRSENVLPIFPPSICSISA